MFYDFKLYSTACALCLCASSVHISVFYSAIYLFIYFSYLFGGKNTINLSCWNDIFHPIWFIQMVFLFKTSALTTYMSNSS